MATTSQRLVGRVAEILNAREVVITLGHAQGLRPGTKFAILTDPLVIKDPESGQELDTLEREKTRVEAVDVRERITICRTYRSTKRNPSLRISPSVLDMLGSQEVQESFHVSKDSTSRNLPYAEEYVKVGDRVVSLSEEES